MKVVCISNVWQCLNGVSELVPVIGDVFTVADMFKDSEGEWYVFVEIPEISFETNGFVPLDDSEEKEQTEAELEEDIYYIK